MTTDYETTKYNLNIVNVQLQFLKFFDGVKQMCWQYKETK